MDIFQRALKDVTDPVMAHQNGGGVEGMVLTFGKVLDAMQKHSVALALLKDKNPRDEGPRQP